MPSQLALDFNRVRIRAVEIDGTLKAPRVTAFAAADIRAHGDEDPEDIATRALAEMIKSQKLTRDPAACALDSYSCTFRELDLPFSQDDQIVKVLKFEAENHLPLVDIDDVVVDYQPIGQPREGSHLLVMAYEKAAARTKFGIMDRSGVDPFFADLHLNALYGALRQLGVFAQTELESDEEEADDSPEPSLPTLVIECDHDVTHLLVVDGDRLLGARAIRLGARTLGAEEPIPEPANLNPDGDGEADEDDDELVILDMEEDDDTELVGEGSAPRILATKDFFARLNREVQRTLFPLGLSDERPRVLMLGPALQEEAFQQRIQVELGREVEVLRPFDLVEHDLDPDIADQANAEGAAALGVALRLLGSEASRVDFRQEDLRFAKRFDQLKVPLSFLAVAAFLVAFLFFLVNMKEYLILKQELDDAAYVAVTTYQEYGSDEKILNDYRNRSRPPRRLVDDIRKELKDTRDDLASSLGREGSIPRVPSGLNILHELILAIDSHLGQLGRLELNNIELDLNKDQPVFKLKGKVLDPGKIDILMRALRENEYVAEVESSKVTGGKDGRVEFQSLQANLTEECAVPRGRKRR